ncbi:integrating conjugative element protein, PFL_4709 family [Legionella beliardensis]|uniref:Integrating conjugative element protein, PFL_4709 family n=1 Tax=Legionella beliardensis TaxID=91822 RepID=A0A378JSF1_9GAMM|nr:DUF1525 domain-containing protein [Legionella beliardensis]STX55441.1 integrating conjugative element protein, PFL_4709 family [Legionella beliardensis]STX55517.1 integrating conjugative element protein, PFL_4709 family [Legionella beliardensis]
MMILFNSDLALSQIRSLKTIELFTLTTMPCSLGHYPVAVCLMDKKRLLDSTLDAELPPQLLQEIVKKSANDYRAFFNCELKAETYQLVYLPAVVFNGEAVMYGVSEIEKAVALWEVRHD